MNHKDLYETIQIGFELNSIELELDEDTVNTGVEIVRWEGLKMMEEKGILPPGLTIANHARMQFNTFPDLKAGIWAKSEHAFIKPLTAGAKIFIRGKIIDKYQKRGKKYVVGEFETRDENGDVLMRSRETSVYIE